MRVKFLRDFRGRATGENYYTAGTVADLPDWQAAMCLAEGAVSGVVVEQVPPLETGVAVSSSTAAPAVTPAPAKTATKRAAKKVKRGAD